ncbi:MAG: hypothetical protein KKF44_05120 [Nanoarchaeota archaeon]|nr:hypothetical protein [Nanoarchaeota archaeon]
MRKAASIAVLALVLAALALGCTKEVENIGSDMGTADNEVHQDTPAEDAALNTYVDDSLLADDDFVEIGEMI